ncbi:hypothetical protein KAR34_07720 [bacterium]|nr:hypothetical protein [bacterium]
MKSNRQSARLPKYNYSSPGAYFITICTKDRVCLFGEIINDEMALNAYGGIVRKCWMEISVHFPDVTIDEMCTMPNHMHRIINIVGARHPTSLRQSRTSIVAPTE